MFEKSYADSGQDSRILLLCEVALGNMKKLWHADIEIKGVKAPYHSVHGCGSRGPDYGQSIFFPNGLELPVGNLVSYTEGDPLTKNQHNLTGSFSLDHNVYIVYNTSQVRMRYLLQVAKKSKHELESEKTKKYGLSG